MRQGRYDDASIAGMFQEVIDSLAHINHVVRTTQDTQLIMGVAGHVYVAETMILVAAQELGLDVYEIDARGPHDG